MTTPDDLPDDERFQDACRDVALRYAMYRNYHGDRTRAMRALTRRTPGFTRTEREAALDLFCEAYRIARDAVPRHVLDRPDKTSRYAEADDIDFEALLAEVDQVRPGWAMKQKKIVASWAILYCYLK